MLDSAVLVSGSLKIVPVFNNPVEEAFETIVGKGENAGYRIYFLSHNVFYPIKDKSKHYEKFILSSANTFQNIVV